MGATARVTMPKSFTPGFVVPKKHVARRMPYATMQVKAFKENSQLQDWRVKDMVEVCVIIYIIFWFRLMMSFFKLLLGFR
jgi:hypothetical protein